MDTLAFLKLNSFSKHSSHLLNTSSGLTETYNLHTILLPFQLINLFSTIHWSNLYLIFNKLPSVLSFHAYAPNLLLLLDAICFLPCNFKFIFHFLFTPFYFLYTISVYLLFSTIFCFSSTLNTYAWTNLGLKVLAIYEIALCTQMQQALSSPIPPSYIQSTYNKVLTEILSNSYIHIIDAHNSSPSLAELHTSATLIQNFHFYFFHWLPSGTCPKINLTLCYIQPKSQNPQNY